MKLFSNLSQRDRSLLVVLLVAVTFYLCYSLIITPALESASILKQEKESLDNDLTRARELIEMKAELEKEASDLHKELIKKYSVFFGSLDQSQLLYKLDTLMLGSGITVSGYAPSPETVATVPLEQGSYTPQDYPMINLAKGINPELYEQQEISQQGSGEASGEASSDMIPSADITFSFENSSYESIYAFLGAIEKMNKTAVLKSADIAKNDTGLGGQLTVAFYSIPPLEQKQKDLLMFNPVLPKGKVNPFQ